MHSGPDLVFENANQIAEYAAELHAKFGCLQTIIELWDQAISMQPNRPDFYLGRSFINMYARRDKAALEDADRGYALDSGLLLAQYIRAIVLFDMTKKTHTASGRSYNNINDSKLKKQSLISFQAAELQYRSSYPIQDFSVIDPRVLLCRVYALRRLGTRSQALDYVDALLRNWTSPSMRVWIDVAAINTFHELGLGEQSQRHLRSCIGRICRHPLAQSWVVYNQALRLDPACSLPMFQHSLRLFFNLDHSARCPHAVDYLCRIANCYEKLGDSQLALQVLTLGLQQYPQSAPLLHSRGLLYSDNGLIDEALNDMRNAQAQDPSCLSRHNAIMAVLGDARRFQEMWTVAEQAITLHCGLSSCTDVCFLSMVVIAGTVQEQFLKARMASDRMLEIQGYLAPGDLEFVSMHRVRLFTSIWTAMQRCCSTRAWLETTTMLMKQKRIVDLHHHLRRYQHELGRDSVDLPISPDGCTTLFWAASNCTDRPELIEVLILDCNAQVDFRNCSGRTALAYAVQNNHYKIASALIALGADTDHRDCLARIPLSYVSEKEDELEMRKAFEQGKIEFDRRKQAMLDEVGELLLHSSSSRLDPNTMSLIFEYWSPPSSQVVDFYRHSLRTAR